MEKIVIIINYFLDWLSDYSETVVALAALCVSIITACHQAKMEKQNVRPYVSFDLVDLQDRIAINLVNDGTGIAIVKKVKIFNKRTLGTSEETNVTAAILNEIKKTCRKGSSFETTSVWKRYDNIKAIGPSRKKVVLETEGQAALNELRKILENLKVTIYYESVFGKKFEVTGDLKYFGR